MIYKVYFGTENNLELISVNVAETSIDITDLIIGMKYFWKVVAHDNYNNHVESPVWSFTTAPDENWECGDILFDNRDGKEYATISVNSQCWMAENLNIGETIPISQNMSEYSLKSKYLRE